MENTQIRTVAQQLRSIALSQEPQRKVRAGIADIPVFYLYDYYPTRFRNVGQSEWNVRHLIWDFKASPNEPKPIELILRNHEQAVAELLGPVSQLIRNVWKDRIRDLTFVCLCASTQEKTERRFADFARQLCERTGMDNGFESLFVSDDGDPKHLGNRARPATMTVNVDRLKGRSVILFDDIITQGGTIRFYAEWFEALGIEVVGAVTIGCTVQYYGQDGLPYAA